MSYADVAALAADPDFLARSAAAYAVEVVAHPPAVDHDPPESSPEHPTSWAGAQAWYLAATPGFGEAYASALVSENPRPGLDPSVITDLQILAAVQSLLQKAR